jgi:hypothetical protein
MGNTYKEFLKKVFARCVHGDKAAGLGLNNKTNMQ